jgi:HlyD family secretion protein
MKKNSKYFFAGIIIVALLAGCSGRQELSDAYGNFEAVTLLVSAEGNGRLLRFKAEEGMHLEQNDTVGLIDTVALSLKRRTLLAKAGTVRSKAAGLSAQQQVMRQQLKNLRREQKRITDLFAGHAATQKQKDDIDGQVAVMELQIRQLAVQRRAVLDEQQVIAAEIAAVEEQIARSYVIAPRKGTVLEKYAEAGELVMPGRVVFKMGDLEEMYLRVYVDETLLPRVRPGSAVQVLIDNGNTLDTLAGTVSWVAGEAEFTPKIIQTRRERVNLVYAVKILVKNDGRLKIGMPGEANFQ